MPAKHRDQLCTLVVLKGYSCIACGSGMRAMDQQKKLYEFVYGKPPNRPSQYDMLIEGASDYKALFTPIPVKLVNNDGKPVEVERLKLNPELIGRLLSTILLQRACNNL